MFCTLLDMREKPENSLANFIYLFKREIKCEKIKPIHSSTSIHNLQSPFSGVGQVPLPSGKFLKISINFNNFIETGDLLGKF